MFLGQGYYCKMEPLPSPSGTLLLAGLPPLLSVPVMVEIPVSQKPPTACTGCFEDGLADEDAV